MSLSIGSGDLEEQQIHLPRIGKMWYLHPKNTYSIDILCNHQHLNRLIKSYNNDPQKMDMATSLHHHHHLKHLVIQDD